MVIRIHLACLLEIFKKLSILIKWDRRVWQYFSFFSTFALPFSFHNAQAVVQYPTALFAAILLAPLACSDILYHLTHAPSTHAQSPTVLPVTLMEHAYNALIPIPPTIHPRDHVFKHVQFRIAPSANPAQRFARNAQTGMPDTSGTINAFPPSYQTVWLFTIFNSKSSFARNVQLASNRPTTRLSAWQTTPIAALLLIALRAVEVFASLAG